MSSIDLVLLGLLAREPSSAYDLARQIGKYDLTDVVRLSIPAIYKNVKNLENRRYLSAEQVRLGEMPEKTVYSLTGEGRQYFYSLMEKYAADRIRYRFEFNSVVMNLDRVPKKKRQKIVSVLKERLAASRKEMTACLEAWKSESPMAQVILDQVELVNEALIEWINEVGKKVSG